MLEHLRFLRDEFSDEIPERIIHSNDTDNRFKVRRNWFTGVVANACNLLDECVLNNEQRIAAEELVDRFTSEEFKDRELTTSEDIETANRLINVILGDNIDS